LGEKKKQALNENLVSVEFKIATLLKNSFGYSLFEEEKNTLVELESKKNSILKLRQEEWGLKSQTIWLKEGDKNSSFFHNFAKHRIICNSIWNLKTTEGCDISSQEGLKKLAFNHFKNFLKVDERDDFIAELKVIKKFPIFFYEEEAISLGKLCYF